MPNPPTPPPPPRPPPQIVEEHHHNNNIDGVAQKVPSPEEKIEDYNNIEHTNIKATPLKAAADLIQTLDIAYAEMTHTAADAAKDAEAARRNARAASEIARRYLHRSYPKVQSPFGARPPTPSPKTSSSSGSGLLRPSNNNYSFESKQQEEEDPLLEITGIASELQTPNHHHSLYSHPPSPSRSRRRNPTFPNASSTDRIAEKHAEDVLSLSMDLERCKQALKSEQRMHEDTKSGLASYKSQTTSLEEQNQKLLEEQEDQRQALEEQTGALEQDLHISKLRLQAAEEDAQLALDLAKESAEKRDETQDLLDHALEELRMLKEVHVNGHHPQHLETPKRSVRFADTATPTPETPRSGGGPSRSMVAAGRQLLRRSMFSPEQEVITLELTPAKSAERRRRLRERLTQLETDLPPPTPTRSTSPSQQQISHHQKSEECHATAKLLQESGLRLDLGGHWWRDRHQSPQATTIRLEAMTRQYCQSVEFKIERQQKEVNELESLCGFLEKKLVTGSSS